MTFFEAPGSGRPLNPDPIRSTGFTIISLSNNELMRICVRVEPGPGGAQQLQLAARGQLPPDAAGLEAGDC